jgi:hypothetical protein
LAIPGNNSRNKNLATSSRITMNDRIPTVVAILRISSSPLAQLQYRFLRPSLKQRY